MNRFHTTLGNLADLLDAGLAPEFRERSIRSICTDSRQMGGGESLFVPIQGPNFDGHRFLDDAARLGALGALARRGGGHTSELPLLEVDDTVVALQKIASWWRSQLNGTVVGITGSNGKTITKEMANSILAQSNRVYRSPGSFNSQVGVALSLLRAPTDCDIYLIECGISRPNEMERLQRMVDPDIGLITNIGTAHIAGLGNAQGIAREKSLLFRDMKGPLIAHESVASFAHIVDLPAELILAGRGAKAAVRVHDEELNTTGCGFRLEHHSSSVLIQMSSFAAHDVDNASCASALAISLGSTLAEIRNGLETHEPVPLRIEVHTSTTGSGITLINDSYSADPVSMASALRTLQSLSGPRRSIAILGEMKELGEQSEAEHRRIGELARAAGVAHLIVVGEKAEPILDAARESGLPDDCRHRALSAEEAGTIVKHLMKPNDVILVKASRPLRLENTAHQVLETLSPTRAYIDLGVIAENVRHLRAWMGGGVALMAVVKSFGYGSDPVRVSELLQQLGADYLVVAYPDEGVLLRRSGITLPILVCSVTPAESGKVAAHSLSAVVYTTELLEALNAVGSVERPIPVHLKVDSGMGRFGLEPAAAREFAVAVGAHSGVFLEGVMSHLAAADDPSQDDYSAEQIRVFAQTVDELENEGITPRFIHLANSAGLWRFPGAHFNAVRLGLGLYGCLDCESTAPDAPQLAPAISLHSRLIGLRDIKPGQTIGYGRNFKADKPMRIGLVALGYNDGLPWRLSNTGFLFLRGKRAPIVGNVCMDVTMIDLTDIPAATVGDDVVVYGSGDSGEPTVVEVARLADTIPYELLCRISARVRRIARLVS